MDMSNIVAPYLALSYSFT